MKNRKLTLVALAASTAMLAACGDTAAEQEQDRLEDQVEMQADQSAVAAGNEEAALGMTEAQLIDADLVTADGTELGEIETVRRDDAGMVSGLVVELEGTPDRWVEIPMADLTTRADGSDMDVQTSMTAEDLAALPDADMGAATGTM